nr:putative reverse transcriptase domain-containing protein [Tanacetum cinerariifolium]
MPEVRKELKICEAHFEKSSVDEPHVTELKELPPHLEYAFLEGDDKLLVIIAKDLSMEEKTALIIILKSHNRAIAWKLSNIKGINPEFCTHKILMEEEFEPAVQHQRRVNPKIHYVINDYDCEIRYHPGKENVVADALSRKEWLKQRRARAMSMTIHSIIKARILEAQSEASKGVNTLAEMLKGLDKQLERKEDGGLYLAERIWVPVYGNLRTSIMNEAHATRYSVHPGVDKMYYDLRGLFWWPGMKKDIAIGFSKGQDFSPKSKPRNRLPGSFPQRGGNLANRTEARNEF